MNIMSSQYDVKRLGACRIDSPVPALGSGPNDHRRVLVDATVSSADEGPSGAASLEQAGAREKIFFMPGSSRIGIVTCGGLSPGINDVVRALTMVSWYCYGVRKIFGFRYGYQGLVGSSETDPIEMTPQLVETIHRDGGTMLGSSRGPQDPCEIVNFLQEHRIDILFTIGGDGTLKGAAAIAKEVQNRNVPIAVVGIPKTIDNDISFTQRTFGFMTAVAESQSVIYGAHTEAKGVRNGIGLVKLMGRESGFVAVYAALASSDVNLVLIPEESFSIEKIMKYLEERLRQKSHAVIVAAEGAGQNNLKISGTDDSGNKKLGDIGLFLKSAITDHFDRAEIPVTIKYIDPSYIIRSAPANASDSVFCFQLAGNAVHAAMAGRTAMAVSLWNGHFVHVPIDLMVQQRKKVETSGLLWQSVLDNTGQPSDLRLSSGRDGG